MAEVIIWHGVTRLDIPVSRVLKAAREAKLSEAVVIGYDKDGDFFFAGSKADGAQALWLLELAKKKLMDIGDNG